ncbi:MAG: T9SS type A sorting domain-containing protein [Ignavibacteriales bacterium]|nr:T9SS type A sorting domain-containing protein [Ignavibacteriales bacterium]
MKKILLTSLFFLTVTSAQDTITYQWPVEPFGEQKVITGTFCEFRNTLSSNHFHNGTDIPKADGSPVYPVLSGTVYSLGTSATDGTSAYVRVKTFIAGKWKHISYVHIEPNPTLAPGSPVTAGVTVLGNILTGQGHTHLTERQLVASENSSGVEIGALREPGGLTPYIDTYTPKVLWVKFYQDNSNIEFTSGKVYGLVDFISQMVERNGTGNPNSSSWTNNGVYHTGYKVLSADKSTVIYNPPGDGVRYKFDYKPNDSQSNVAYTLESTTSQHIYILTNGTGNIGISTSHRTITNNSFNSSLFPAGQYQLLVYAHDTHGNADTVYVPFEISSQDVIAPAPPVLESVLNDSTNTITVSWYPNTEPDLKGYRLFSSVNGSTWVLQKDEFVLNRNITKYSFTGISQTTPVYFKLTAVDSAAITNESIASDIYGLRPNLGGKKVLVIDAFDRTSGSYAKPTHPFAMTAGQSINARFETAHNRAVTDGSVNLANYDAVFWSFGDEGSTDETFGAQEQSKAMAYLQQGGKLFAAGSEVGYDLDRSSGPSQSDRDFFNNYLKADFAGDESGNYTINGKSGSFLEGVTFSYGDTIQGSPYVENFPDYFNAFGGSSVVAAYGNSLGAATAFTGTFAGGSAPGAVVLIGVPFETIHTKPNRDALMTKVLNYFGVATSVIDRNDGTIPEKFSLEQNYPNPFNPTTEIRYQISEVSMVTLKVYDMLGKELTTLVDEELTPGTYRVQWNAHGIASGIYFYRLTAKDFSATKKLMLMK